MTDPIHVRRGQLITTYGVGSLFPSESDSFMIRGIHEWPEDNLSTVSEPRLQRKLGVTRLLAPPANVSSRADAKANRTPRFKRTIPVYPFPRTYVCPNSKCSAVGNSEQLQRDRSKGRCGLCDEGPTLVPSRFILSCEKGHLDDFPYFEWAHHGHFPDRDWWDVSYGSSEAGHRLKLVAQGQSSGLADLVVECSCGEKKSMQNAFSASAFPKNRPCSGQRLWLGREYNEACDQRPRAVQRGASNVWFGVTDSAISIPPYSSRLVQLVSRHRRGLRGYSADALTPPLSDEVRRTLSHVRANEAIAESLEEVAGAARLLLHPGADAPVDAEQIRQDEFQAILRCAKAEPGDQFDSREEIVPPSCRGWVEQVRMLPRLRVVSALKGFTRLKLHTTDADGGAEVSPLFPEDCEIDWLPATELLGEGLFISLDSKKVQEWTETQFAKSRGEMLDANRRAAIEQNPGHSASSMVPIDMTRVALHSISHMVMDQLALDAGYPVSALKERLYVGPDMCGFLIYTASSDAAGSLGGVASMARREHLEHALAEAHARHSWCPSDPVCAESSGSGTDGVNLAACHSCLLLPETSCEGFNAQLDRSSVVGPPDDPGLGLIDWLTNNAPDHTDTDEPLSPDRNQHAEDPDSYAWNDDSYEELSEQIPELERLLWYLDSDGFPLPEPETTAGPPSREYEFMLVWPTAQVAVDIEEDPERDSYLRNKGWTVAISDTGRGQDVWTKVSARLRAAFGPRY